MKKYQVKHIPKGTMNFSMNSTDLPWDKANMLTDFKNPWNANKIPKTEFRALWDPEFLYFRFDAEDTSIHVKDQDNSNESIGASDRVELFFRKVKNLNPYYCMEIDAKARIMDFKARPDKNFDFDWGYTKEHLKVDFQITANGYVVEGALSIAYLKSLDLMKEGALETGIFRAKHIKQKGSDFEPTWITWVDPQTETHNFHISSSFGVFLDIPMNRYRRLSLY